MQQYNRMENLIISSINRVNITSNPIDYNMETGIMIKFLNRKYKNHPNHVAQSLGMSNKDINQGNFSKEQFRKLLNFYMGEKVQ